VKHRGCAPPAFDELPQPLLKSIRGSDAMFSEMHSGGLPALLISDNLALAVWSQGANS
jgi:hypothetical protein